MTGRNTQVLPPEQLEGLLKEFFDAGPPLPLTVTGNSMLPFLVHGRDRVILSPVDRPLKRGDLVLYRRENGDWVLHRIHRIREDGLDLVGDAQTELEPIRPGQVRGLVTRVIRKGKNLGPDSFLWGFFEHFWPLVRPIRPLLIRCWSALKPREVRP